MQISNSIALLTLPLALAASASGSQVGLSCVPVGALVGRRDLSAVELPTRHVLRRCLNPRDLLVRNSDISPLVARAWEPPTRPLGSDGQPMDWEPPSSPGSSEESASTSSKRKTQPSELWREGKMPTIREKTPEVDGDQQVSLDPNRLNVPHPDRHASMHLITTPSPTISKGLLDPKTGERSYFVTVADTHKARPAVITFMTKHPGVVDPSFMVATSENQLGGHLSGYGPAEWEQVKDTGDLDLSKKPVWLRMTPEKGWTEHRLRKNLAHQHLHFPNHDAGQRDSKWAGIHDEMRANCKFRRNPCTAESPEGWIVGATGEEPLTPRATRSP